MRTACSSSHPGGVSTSPHRDQALPPQVGTPRDQAPLPEQALPRAGTLSPPFLWTESQTPVKI